MMCRRGSIYAYSNRVLELKREKRMKKKYKKKNRFGAISLYHFTGILHTISFEFVRERIS